MVLIDNVTVVNMVPHSLSGDQNQDSEPNIAVNPANTQQIAGMAFTPNPNGGPNSPIYYSDDGGMTWSLPEIIAGTPVRDQTLRFAWTSGNLYAAVLWGAGFLISTINYDILRTNNFPNPPIMTVLAHRTNDDQPFIEAATVPQGADAGKDRIYVGSNDWAPAFQTASIDESLDAAIAAPAINTLRLERRNPQRDGFQTRPSIHADGTIYAIFYSWDTGPGNSSVVICRDDNWGAGATPFQALLDPNDNLAGLRIVTGINVPAFIDLGQQRIGGNLSIAVDPRNSSIAYVCWGGLTNNIYTLHVRGSTDRGRTWSANDLFHVDNATNPALAINSSGRLGLLYQQVTGVSPNQRWQTKVVLTNDVFVTTTEHVLANTPADTPVATFDPYLGDYLYMMAVGSDFYGIFCANNTPNTANFPSGITPYARVADWTNHVLRDLAGNQVPISIDPFFFKIHQTLKLFGGKELKPEKFEIKENWFYEKWRWWGIEKLPWHEKSPWKSEYVEKEPYWEIPKTPKELYEGFGPPWPEPQPWQVIERPTVEIEKEQARSRAFIRNEERPKPEDRRPKKKSKDKRTARE